MARRPLLVVLRPLGLGDFLAGVPAYRAIARAFGRHRIVLAAPRVLAPLAELTGVFERVHDTQPLVPLDAQLGDADIAVDLHGRGPASQRILLAARPRRLIAFANAEVAQTAAGAEWRSDEHEVARWCRMLAHAGIAVDERELDLARPRVRIPPGVAGATLVHASAASESRRWPAQRWAAVARAQRSAGANVIFTGDARDRERVLAIAAAAAIPAAQVYAGRTTLGELAALVAASGRVVCSDTGVAHLATAYRRPSVVLFGPTPPAWWGPPPERRYHRVLWAGRLGDPHATSVDPGLLEISVADVNAALEQLGAGSVSSAPKNNDRLAAVGCLREGDKAGFFGHPQRCNI